MTQPFLVKPRPQSRPLSIDQLLALLGAEQLNALDADARVMRERYQCPLTVRDYEEFRRIIWDFWAHYLKTYFNIDHGRAGMDDFTKRQAYEFVERYIGGYQELLTAETNAIAGRDGGMIAVIDAMTDAIIKHHTETYIRSVFFELIEPGDYELRLRLAQELLKKYGGFLFPDEQLVPHWVLANNLEAFIQGFVNTRHALLRQWRR